MFFAVHAQNDALGVHPVEKGCVGIMAAKQRSTVFLAEEIGLRARQYGQVARQVANPEDGSDGSIVIGEHPGRNGTQMKRVTDQGKRTGRHRRARAARYGRRAQEGLAQRLAFAFRLSGRMYRVANRQPDKVQIAHDGDAFAPFRQLRPGKDVLEYPACVGECNEHGLVRTRNVFAEYDVHDPQHHVLALRHDDAGISPGQAHLPVEIDRPSRVHVADSPMHQAFGGAATYLIDDFRRGETLDPVNGVSLVVGRRDDREQRVEDVVFQKGRVDDGQPHEIRVDATPFHQVHQRRAGEGVSHAAVVDVDQGPPSCRSRRST